VTEIRLLNRLERSLPGHYYSAPEIWEREKERLFYRKWLCAAREEELEGPGDFSVRLTLRARGARRLTGGREAPPELRAVIFDFSGVLLLDEPRLYLICRDGLARRGISLDRGTYDRLVGLSDREFFARALEAHGHDARPRTIAALVRAKTARYLREVAAAPPLAPGAAELVRGAAARWPCALAAGAPRREVTAVLRATKLAGCFRAVVALEDLERGKPDPEVFRTALVRLNAAAAPAPPIEPAGCLVVEDSPLGVEAAHLAGMRALAVATSLPPPRLAGADWIVSTLEGLDADRLVTLWAGRLARRDAQAWPGGAGRRGRRPAH